jgi:hypothetical protein
MFNRFMPFALACAMTGLAPAASAQQQTAAGAQKFLGMLAKDKSLYVQMRDRNGAYLLVNGTRTKTYRWLNDGVPASDGPYADSSEPISTSLKGMLGIVAMDSVDRSGNADDCTTRVEARTAEKLGNASSEDTFTRRETFFSTEKVYYRITTTDQFEDPVAKFGGVRYASWSKAVVSRADSGRILATFAGSTQDLQLVYAGDVTKDAEMSDRVEYAMKFLKASCDKTAATGF